jgi:uncharacterized membrane protein required for colicin V production
MSTPAPLAITTPDTVVLVLIAFFGLRGAFKGFVWQLIRTGGLFAGLFLAARYAEPVGAFLSDRFNLPQPEVVGWIVVMVGTFVAVTVVAHLVRNTIHQARLGGLDRVLGLVLGAVLGLGVGAFGFTLWASWRPASEVKETLGTSVSLEWMAKFVREVEPLFPEAVRKKWSPVLGSLSN